MGRVRPPDPAAFLCALTFRDPAWAAKAKESLQGRLGVMALQSAPFPFNHTDYYAREMGEGLSKVLLCFETLRDPGEIAALKRWTQTLEGEMADSGRRRVNLDPGYLTGAKVVLASTKDFAHRVYIGDGIYGEVTLLHRDGAFQPLPWTYPDYRQDPALGFLEECRRWYVSRRRATGA
jgi:hypothetical protein